MNRKLFFYYAVVFYIVFLAFGKPAFADKSSVRIEAPETAAIGQEITITLHVSHDGNNFIHHTDWIYVKINDQEIKRWEFGMFDTPESEHFTREIQYTVTGPITITAEADCNMHGSAGIAEKKIPIQ
ncbi:MAG: hypothetical protein C4522_14100 [Desulfobacteraceae bacterium]|nr:MAG: hypothetical protein C4522_14100 [Desulfobacteraceae bacterium]